MLARTADVREEEKRWQEIMRYRQALLLRLTPCQFVSANHLQQFLAKIVVLRFSFVGCLMRVGMRQADCVGHTLCSSGG
jgi:hypothetical protein